MYIFDLNIWKKWKKKLKPSHSNLAIIYYFSKHHHLPEILIGSLKAIFDSFPSDLPLMRCHPLVAEFLASTAPSTLPVKNFTNAPWHVLSTDVLASPPPLLHSRWHSWHRLPWSKLVFPFSFQAHWSTRHQLLSLYSYIPEVHSKDICIVSPFVLLNLHFFHSEHFIFTISAYCNAVYEDPVKMLLPPWGFPRFLESEAMSLSPAVLKPFICFFSKSLSACLSITCECISLLLCVFGK